VAGELERVLGVMVAPCAGEDNDGEPHTLRVEGAGFRVKGTGLLVAQRRRCTSWRGLPFTSYAACYMLARTRPEQSDQNEFESEVLC
jgi:hypothetical protein